MEEIRKRMARANALLASKEREAYHAEMRLIQQVTSPPFPLADVYLENRRKCSANFSLAFAASFPLVSAARKQHTETPEPAVNPHACVCAAQELLRAEIALQNDLAAEGFSQPSLKNFKGGASRCACPPHPPPRPLETHHAHAK